jgi:hypothetical protein
MGGLDMILHKLPIKLQNQIRKSFLNYYYYTSKNELKLFANELKKYFSKNELEKIARGKKFIQRRGLVEAWQMLNFCCFSNLDMANDTLVKLSSRFSINSGKSISSQAIDQRFNEKCVLFLKSIFHSLLNEKISYQTAIPTKLDCKFNRIRVLDSTAFQVPENYKIEYPGSGGSANTAGIKIQLEYELKSGEFINVQEGPGSDSDNTFGTKIRSSIGKNDLILRDLGYFSIEEFKAIEKSEAFYISRLKPNIAVYVENDNIQYYKNGSIKKSSIFKRINLKDIINTMKPGELTELTDVYIGRDNKYKTRLIVYRLTEKQLLERRKKTLQIAKKKGIKKSSNTMDLLEISMYITNIPVEMIDLQKIYKLYTLRWQVEIIFKIWKSIYHVNKLKKVKIERFQCQLYGKLILILISSTVMFKIRKILLIKENREGSEIKLSQVVNEHIGILYFALIEAPHEVFKVLLNIFILSKKNALKSHKKLKKTAFEIMETKIHNSKGEVKNSA